MAGLPFKRVLLLLVCLCGLCLLLVSPVKALKPQAEEAEVEAEQADVEEALNSAAELEAPSYADSETATSTTSTTARGAPVAGIAVGTALVAALVAGVLLFLKKRAASQDASSPEAPEQEALNEYEYPDEEIID
ncbi:hypothetical protein Emag_007404 [Eimeria magna]